MSPDDIEGLARAVRNNDRRAVARAISLVESTAAVDTERADALLRRLYAAPVSSLRIGVCGPPGVGKSTLVDALGSLALADGRRVAVMAVDPSSRVRGGSLLGDRTRMTRLARCPEVFVRASPSSGASGGVGRRCPEALTILEAAGHDLLLVETVGIGQAELGAVDVVDVLLVVQLAGAGDDVQGIKRGILEHADVLAFNKADGANIAVTEAARLDAASMLALLQRDAPPVLAVSATQGNQLAELWGTLVARGAQLEAQGVLEERRRARRLSWFQARLQEEVQARFARGDAGSQRLRELRTRVESGQLLPLSAARELLA